MRTVKSDVIHKANVATDAKICVCSGNETLLQRVQLLRGSKTHAGAVALEA